MKKLLLALVLLPLAFAAWETTAGVAILTAITIVAIMYAIGFGLDINELKMVAKEEIFQIIALVIMMAVFYGTDNLITSISENEGFAQGSGTIQEKADEILDDWSSDTETKLNTVIELDNDIAIEASKAYQCSLFGMGYSVSTCGAYSMLNPPLGMAGGIIGFSYAEVSGMQKFVHISNEYSLTVLLPIGILLRTFKVTRGAGGFFIAVAISLHILLPLGIIFNEMLAQTFEDSANAAEYTGTLSSSISEDYECDGDNTGNNVYAEALELVGLKESNNDLAKGLYGEMREGIKSFLTVVLLRATLGPVIALLIVMASIRGLSSLMGAEVDVSAIARFA